MIFAFATDDRTLMVFNTAAEAISYAEGVDVEDGGWKFYDTTGQPLEPLFTKPNRRGSFSVISGEYELVPSKNASETLRDLLPNVSTVEGKRPLDSVPAVESWLSSNSSFDPDAQARRST